MVHSAKNVTEGTMPSEEKMSVDERRKYLKLVAPRYAKAGRTHRFAPTAIYGRITANWYKPTLEAGLTMDRNKGCSL